MKIRNDDRLAFRAGNYKDIDPKVLEILKKEGSIETHVYDITAQDLKEEMASEVIEEDE